METLYLHDKHIILSHNELPTIIMLIPSATFTYSLKSLQLQRSNNVCKL